MDIKTNSKVSLNVSMSGINGFEIVKVDVQDYFGSFHSLVLSKYLVVSVMRLFTTHADLYFYGIQ